MPKDNVLSFGFYFMKEDKKKTYLNYSLNFIIIVLIILCGGFIWSMVKGNKPDKEPKPENIRDTIVTKSPEIKIDAKTITAEVLNGSGENKIGKVFTDFLIKKNVDVQKTDNYKSNTVQKTIIMSRRGEIIKAQKIGELLGVNNTEIIENTDKDLFIDVTVLVGKDFGKLKPYTEKNK